MNITPEYINSEYEIKGQLGEGSYGKVLKLQHKTTQETLAQKYIFASGEQQLNQALNEILNMTRLERYENVVKLIYYNIEQVEQNQKGRYINFNKINMFLECGDQSLEKEILEYRNLKQIYDIKLIQNILRDLIFTFAEMQENKLAHRDIKPGNIIKFNKTQKYKIADFGLCQFQQRHIMENNGTFVPGTPPYMDPDLFYENHIRTQKNSNIRQIVPDYNLYKADVFSLGLTILEMATLQEGTILNLNNRQLQGQEKIRQRLQIMKLIYKNQNQEVAEQVFNVLQHMLQYERQYRLDFIELKQYFHQIEKDTSFSPYKGYHNYNQHFSQTQMIRQKIVQSQISTEDNNESFKKMQTEGRNLEQNNFNMFNNDNQFNRNNNFQNQIYNHNHKKINLNLFNQRLSHHNLGIQSKNGFQFQQNFQNNLQNLQNRHNAQKPGRKTHFLQNQHFQPNKSKIQNLKQYNQNYSQSNQVQNKFSQNQDHFNHFNMQNNQMNIKNNSFQQNFQQQYQQGQQQISFHQNQQQQNQNFNNQNYNKNNKNNNNKIKSEDEEYIENFGEGNDLKMSKIQSTPVKMKISHFSNQNNQNENNCNQFNFQNNNDNFNNIYQLNIFNNNNNDNNNNFQNFNNNQLYMINNYNNQDQNNYINTFDTNYNSNNECNDKQQLNNNFSSNNISIQNTQQSIISEQSNENNRISQESQYNNQNNNCSQDDQLYKNDENNINKSNQENNQNNFKISTETNSNQNQNLIQQKINQLQSNPDNQNKNVNQSNQNFIQSEYRLPSSLDNNDQQNRENNQNQSRSNNISPINESSLNNYDIIQNSHKKNIYEIPQSQVSIINRLDRQINIYSQCSIDIAQDETNIQLNINQNILNHKNQNKITFNNILQQNLNNNLIYQKTLNQNNNNQNYCNKKVSDFQSNQDNTKQLQFNSNERQQQQDNNIKNNNNLNTSPVQLQLCQQCVEILQKKLSHLEKENYNKLMNNQIKMLSFYCHCKICASSWQYCQCLCLSCHLKMVENYRLNIQNQLDLACTICNVSHLNNQKSQNVSLSLTNIYCSNQNLTTNINDQYKSVDHIIPIEQYILIGLNSGQIFILEAKEFFLKMEILFHQTLIYNMLQAKDIHSNLYKYLITSDMEQIVLFDITKDKYDIPVNITKTEKLILSLDYDHNTNVLLTCSKEEILLFQDFITQNSLDKHEQQNHTIKLQKEQQDGKYRQIKFLNSNKFATIQTNGCLKIWNLNEILFQNKQQCEQQVTLDKKIHQIQYNQELDILILASLKNKIYLIQKIRSSQSIKQNITTLKTNSYVANMYFNFNFLAIALGNQVIQFVDLKKLYKNNNNDDKNLEQSEDIFQSSLDFFMGKNSLINKKQLQNIQQINSINFEGKYIYIGTTCSQLIQLQINANPY